MYTITGIEFTDTDALIGASPDCNQYCVGIMADGEILIAYRAVDSEPTQVIPEATGSYTLVFPAPSLDEAKAHAHEVLAGYLDMCEVVS